MRIIDILSENDGTPPTVVDKDGNKFWSNAAGKLHREDGPAVIFSNGHQAWWRDGNLHRTDGPAIIFNDGEKHWLVNGKYHRTDGPAKISKKGKETWYLNDKKATDMDMILLRAGAKYPWHAQPDVVAKLSTPEQKKQIMRHLTLLTRSAAKAAKKDVGTLRKLGVGWPELDAMERMIGSVNQIKEDKEDHVTASETERMQDIRAILDQIQVMRR